MRWDQMTLDQKITDLRERAAANTKTWEAQDKVWDYLSDVWEVLETVQARFTLTPKN